MNYIDAEQAAKIFSNFTLFANIQNQLEGGCLYGASDSGMAASEIIRICEKEKTRLLAKYDARFPTGKRTKSKVGNSNG